MPEIHISILEVQAFVLILFRVGAIVMTAPMFESGNIALPVKALLSFGLAFLVSPVVNVRLPAGLGLEKLALGILGEVIIGMVIGYTTRLMFSSIELAGLVAGRQMGFAMAQSMDPMSQQQMPIIAEFKNLLAILLFLGINAHHFFIRALAESFEIAPPLGVGFHPNTGQELIQLTGKMFVNAVKVGAPLIGALLLSTTAIGLVAKTVKGMNVFIVGLPVKIFVGLLFFGASLPYFVSFYQSMFADFARDILVLLKTLGG